MNPEIEEPVFGMKVYLQVGGSEAEIVAQWSDLTDDGLWADGSHGFVVLDKTGRLLVWLAEKPGAGRIAHECVHIAIRTMEVCGVPVNAKNQEVIAYLVHFWANQLQEACYGPA